MSVLNRIKDATIIGNQKGVAEFTNQALAEGVRPATIIQEGLIPAMATVGLKFKNGDIFVPEMLVAARAMKAGLEIIKPLMVETDMKNVAKVVLGTVKGDLHDIGKNLVGIMLEGAGMEVIDLGVDISPEKFVAAVKTHKPGFVAMSALLTTTMPNMQAIIEAFEAEGLRDSVKVLIGGAPVSEEFADKIGADGYADNAASAVDKIKEFLD